MPNFQRNGSAHHLRAQAILFPIKHWERFNEFVISCSLFTRSVCASKVRGSRVDILNEFIGISKKKYLLYKYVQFGRQKSKNIKRPLKGFWTKIDEYIRSRIITLKVESFYITKHYPVC